MFYCFIFIRGYFNGYEPGIRFGWHKVLQWCGVSLKWNNCRTETCSDISEKEHHSTHKEAFLSNQVCEHTEDTIHHLLSHGELNWIKVFVAQVSGYKRTRFCVLCIHGVQLQPKNHTAFFTFQTTFYTEITDENYGWQVLYRAFCNAKVEIIFFIHNTYSQRIFFS